MKKNITNNIFLTFLVLFSLTMVFHPAVSFADCASNGFDESGDPCTPPADTSAATPAATTPTVTTQTPGTTPGTSTTTPASSASTAKTTPTGGVANGALVQYTLLEPLPSLNGKGGTVSSVDIQGFIYYLFRIVIAVTVLLAVVMVTWGGFQYMTVESVTGKSDAKHTIENAIFGLLGALGSYLILYTVNPQLVNLNLVNIPKLNVTIDPNALGINSDNNYINQINDQISAASSAQNNLNLQAAADQAALTNLQNQYSDANCDDDANQTSNLCSTLNDQIDAAQATAASSTSAAATQLAISTMALNRTTATQVTSANQLIGASNSLASINTTNANNALALLPNGDVADKITITNNLALSNTQLQNQAALLTYQQAGKYDDVSTAQATQAISTATNQAVQQINDPTGALQQQLITGEKQQIAAIQALNQNYDK